MRLSAEVLSLSEQRSNALGEREIVLRGLSIPAIEHLAATRDLFDAIDLADNRIARVENFPRLLRLSSLFLSNNVIESVDSKNLVRNAPGLTNLVLTGNRISGLHEVTNIAAGCPKLEFLTLMGNPVTRRQHYRLFTIHKIPSLKVLDFMKVKEDERARANRLAKSAAGAALECDVKVEAREAAKTSKTFTPGEGQSAKESFVANFNPEQKAKIREMVANAASPMEIEKIEASVKQGKFPEYIPPPPPTPTSTTVVGKKTVLDTNGEAERNAKKSKLQT